MYLTIISFGQDTVVYRGFLNGNLLYESIELYPDSTFKWTSEYDLNWNEYGLYNIDKNNLKLIFFLESGHPKTMSLRDSILQIEMPTKIENFIIDKEKLYRQTNSGQKIMRIKDKSIKTPWSWAFGHKYELKKE